MIQIKMPKEISQYKAKFIGPFSLRETICLAIGLAGCVGLYMLLEPYLGVDITGFIMFIPAGIAYLFGWYKPYGMTFEKYMQSVFVNSVLAPSKRLYKTENFYSSVLKEIKKEEEAAAAASDSKKTRKKKKDKYVRSKLAIK